MAFEELPRRAVLMTGASARRAIVRPRATGGMDEALEKWGPEGFIEGYAELRGAAFAAAAGGDLRRAPTARGGAAEAATRGGDAAGAIPSIVKCCS